MDISNAEKVSKMVEELNILKKELEYLLDGTHFYLEITKPMGSYYGLISNIRWPGQDNWRTLAMIEAYHKRISELEEELEKL